jgi:hypothetical protein
MRDLTQVKKIGWRAIVDVLSNAGEEDSTSLDSSAQEKISD